MTYDLPILVENYDVSQRANAGSEMFNEVYAGMKGPLDDSTALILRRVNYDALTELFKPGGRLIVDSMGMALDLNIKVEDGMIKFQDYSRSNELQDFRPLFDYLQTIPVDARFIANEKA